MKRVRTSDLRPGMRTAEDVYSFNNQLILQKDTILDDKMITRLEFYSVLAIRIAEDPVSETALENQTSMQNSSYAMRVRTSEQFKRFEKNYLDNAESFKNNLDSIANDESEINTGQLLNMITDMVSSDMTGMSVFDMLHNMRQYDDFTYMHSMNVSLICYIFAQWLHLSKSDIEIVTMGGLLHDIGKLKVPDNIIRKPEKLSPSEYNIIKTHTLQGYNILKAKNLNPDIPNCALMHHERNDGTGYPLGIKGDKINPFAKIIAIADVYDAMTAARIYRGPLCPFRVISIFEAEGLQKYESSYLLCFLEHIATTYMNNRVRLNNGMEGEVVFMNRNQYSRPMIKCGDEFIDLTHEPQLFIETFV